MRIDEANTMASKSLLYLFKHGSCRETILLKMSFSTFRDLSRLYGSAVETRTSKRKWHFYQFCDFGTNRCGILSCIHQEKKHLTKFAIVTWVIYDLIFDKTVSYFRPCSSGGKEV